MLDALAHLVAGSRRRAAITVISWLLLAGVASQLFPSLASVENNEGINDPPAAAESVQARNLVRQAFPDQRGTPAIVVYRNAGGLSDADLAEVRRVSEVLNGPGKPEGVAGAVSVATTSQTSTLMSADRTTTVMLVPVLGSPSDDGFNETVDAVRSVVGRGSAALEVRVTGPAGIIRDTLAAFGSANLVLLFSTLGLVLVLLLLIYRSPVLAVIPLVSAGLAIQLTNALGAGLVELGAFEVNSQAASIMTVLLFGVGTDYCLFVISRYRERLMDEPDRLAAMRWSIRGVGESLIFSAATVILGLLVLLLATLPALRGFGPFLALAVAVMLLVGLTFVPAVVVLTGRAAFWPARAANLDRRGRGRGLWERVADQALGRPGRTAAIGTMLLVLLSAGLVDYRESYNFLSGFRVVTDSKQGQDLLNQGFPAGELAPTTVLIDTGGRPVQSALADIDRVTRAVAAVPGVRSVSGPTAPQGQSTAPPAIQADGQQFIAPNGTLVRLSVVYADDPYQAPALDRTERVREVVRDALAQSGSGASVLVGGESATNLDLREANRRDLSVIVPITLLLIALVLALLLRSVVAPIYMILTTILSLLATIGITTVVLVTLGGDEGIGNRVTAYIFVFLVALGVDYNIFLMSRVRREALRYGFLPGLRYAMVRTGGVISSAGVILAGTFAVLMTQPIRELFQFGFAMAVGILLDTFLVRGTLVPAIVRLLGRWNWWPGGLVLPRESTPAKQSSLPIAAAQAGPGESYNVALASRRRRLRLGTLFTVILLGAGGGIFYWTVSRKTDIPVTDRVVLSSDGQGMRNGEQVTIRIPGTPPQRSHLALILALNNPAKVGDCVHPALLDVTPLVDGQQRPSVSGTRPGREIQLDLTGVTSQADVVVTLHMPDSSCIVDLDVGKAVLYD